MTISFVAATEGTDADQGASVTIPAEVGAGDLLVAILATNSISGYSHITPSGWALVGTSHGSADGGSQFATLFTRTATGADANGNTVFGISPSGSKDTLCVAAYRGTDTPPFVAAAGTLPYSGTAGTTVPVPVVDVPDLPATLVTAVSKKGGTAEITTTPPAGFTQRTRDFVDGGGSITCAIADATASATGDTTVAAWDTSVSSAAGTAFLIAITEGTPPPLQSAVFRRLTVDGWFPPIG